MVKTCNRCKVSKDLEHFSKNRSRPDGLQSYCRPCNVIRANARRDSLRDKVNELKATLFCQDCNETHPATLDFHHIDPSAKSYAVSFMACRGYTYDAILEEVNKCVVLCSNCHRKRHWNERLNKDNGA